MRHSLAMLALASATVPGVASGQITLPPGPGPGTAAPLPGVTGTPRAPAFPHTTVVVPPAPPGPPREAHPAARAGAHADSAGAASPPGSAPIVIGGGTVDWKAIYISSLEAENKKLKSLVDTLEQKVKLLEARR